MQTFTNLSHAYGSQGIGVLHYSWNTKKGKSRLCWEKKGRELHYHLDDIMGDILNLSFAVLVGETYNRDRVGYS